MGDHSDLEDERMGSSQMPLLVLSGEVIFYLTPNPSPKEMGTSALLPSGEGLGMKEKHSPDRANTSHSRRDSCPPQ
jgi:hypothetical protein